MTDYDSEISPACRPATRLLDTVESGNIPAEVIFARVTRGESRKSHNRNRRSNGARQHTRLLIFTNFPSFFLFPSRRKKKKKKKKIARYTVESDEGLLCTLAGGASSAVARSQFRDQCGMLPRGGVLPRDFLCV